jgi:hypothetical protein
MYWVASFLTGDRNPSQVKVPERECGRGGRNPMNDNDHSRQAPVSVRLASFGKHPAWNDHMEDLGLETANLNQFKQVLYFSGIRGNVDSGTWDKQESHAPPLRFHHRVLYLLPDAVILARLWASSDGKGRTRYPLVVCAECPRAALDWALVQVPSRLDLLEKRLLPSLQADEVREHLDRTRRELQDLALRTAATPEAQAVATPAAPDVIRQLAARPEMAPNRQGLLRVLYAIERHMHAFAPGTGHQDSTHSAQLRVPTCADSFLDAMRLWSAFLTTQLDLSTPLMVLCPLDAPWIDLLVGTPGMPQLFCLKATEDNLPLTTSIPYSFEEDFLARAQRILDDATAKTPPASLSVFRDIAPAAAPGPLAAWSTRLSSLFGTKTQQS